MTFRPKSLIEANVGRSEGEEVDEDLYRALFREHQILVAALDHPRAIVETRLSTSMLAGHDDRLFWASLKEIAKLLPKEAAIDAHDVVAEMVKRGKVFPSKGDHKLFVDGFAHYPRPSLAYVLGVLVPERVAAADNARFRDKTEALNARVGKDEPILLNQEYLTEALAIARSPDGRPTQGSVGKRVLTWDAKELAKGIVPSGVVGIDLTSGGGPGPGDLVVIGGGTNHGKSYMGEMLLWHAASMGVRMLYLSTEDPEELMMCRLIARHTDPAQKPVWIRAPPLPNDRSASEYDPAAIERARALVDPKECIFVDKRRKGRISDICDTLRRYRFEHGIQAAAVDYLQAIQIDEPTKGTPNLVQETARKVGLLKECADSLGMPLYLMSQYARDEYKDGAEPGINACKYAGDIENESEIMVLFWRSAQGELLAKIPKAKWVETTVPRFIVRRQPKTGCFMSWENDFGAGQGQAGGQGQSARPQQRKYRSGGRQL